MALKVTVWWTIGLIGEKVKTAIGGRLTAATKIDLWAEAFAPPLSVIVSTTVSGPPTVWYVWSIIGKDTLVRFPSPKFQEYSTMLPSGSWLAEASKWTGMPSVGLGDTVNDTVGGMS